jgi:choline-sulfatase
VNIAARCLQASTGYLLSTRWLFLTTTIKQHMRMLMYFLLAIILAAGACRQANPPPFAPFDNVVVLIGDDHAAEVLACYDNDIIRTPNLDRMAAQGVRFTRAYANAPLCSASRQSILTGRYPHAAGVTLLRTSFPDEQFTIAEHLAEHGFHTGVVGKTHFNNDGAHGFAEVVKRAAWLEWLQRNPPRLPPEGVATYGRWRPFQDPAAVWLNAEQRPQPYYDEAMEDTYYAKQAIDFIEKNQHRRFCLWVGFHQPHSPFHFPLEYAGKYRPDDMPLPSVGPEDERWIPLVFKGLREEERRGIIAAYYTSVEHLDQNVGRVLDKIDQLGLGEKTLVVYIGDQGYLLGHHGRFEKHMMWEEAIRAPLIVRGPARFPPGKASAALAEFVDLAPTILDALGIPPLPDAQGKSLLPVLRGHTDRHKDYVFSEFLADNKAMVRGERWKYIFTSGKRDLGQGYATGYPPSGILHRLYDLENDPAETNDLARDPRYQNELRALQNRLLEWFRQTHPHAGAIPDDLPLDEQLVLFCEPPDVGADLEAR